MHMPSWRVWSPSSLTLRDKAEMGAFCEINVTWDHIGLFCNIFTLFVAWNHFQLQAYAPHYAQFLRGRNCTCLKFGDPSSPNGTRIKGQVENLHSSGESPLCGEIERGFGGKEMTY